MGDDFDMTYITKAGTDSCDLLTRRRSLGAGGMVVSVFAQLRMIDAIPSKPRLLSLEP